jgi:hypothetical protein
MSSVTQAMNSRCSVRLAVVACLALVVGCSPSRDLVSTPWKLIRTLRSNTVFVLAISGGCIRFEKIEVDERPNEVILTALSKDRGRLAAPSRDLGQPGITCPGDLQLNAVAVCLRAPLGTRPLTRAPISSVWHGPPPEKVSVPSALTEPEPCAR